MRTLLDIQELSIRFIAGETENEVVHGISFKIQKGDIVGLVGESGSGKSVSALSLMRLLPSAQKCRTGGSVYINDDGKKVDLFKLPEEEMRQYRGNKLGMIFQEPMTSLNPVFTCGEQVAEGIRVHQKVSRKEAETQVKEWFNKVKLPQPGQIFHRYPHQLSGGQKQRVMIAMAMSCNPYLIIADEPTTALDVTVQRAILDLLKDLQQQLGISVLFITHDLGVIRAIANKVLVMYKGTIVEQGAINDIFSNPRHPYTKGLLACRPPTDRILKKLPVMSDFIQMDGGEMVSRRTDMGPLIRSLEMDPAEKNARRESMKETVLEVKDLVVRFPGKKNFLGKILNWTLAVNEVSFDVKQGEVLGLAGESGCGKTTLGRAILQLIRPVSGEVWFKGRNLCTLSGKDLRKMRPRLQLIFQDPYSALNPRLTIGESILEPMQVHGLHKNDRNRRKKIRELLQKVDLDPDLVKSYPHEFSGGQRQRICIARALALQPEFIICDESVSALDVSIQAQVLNLLLELRSEFHFSCIFISHDLSVVKFMCDRIMIMNKGSIEEIGPAEQIYHHPQTPYTQQLIAAIPR